MQINVGLTDCWDISMLLLFHKHVQNLCKSKDYYFAYSNKRWNVSTQQRRLQRYVEERKIRNVITFYHYLMISQLNIKYFYKWICWIIYFNGIKKIYKRFRKTLKENVSIVTSQTAERQQQKKKPTGKCKRFGISTIQWILSYKMLFAIYLNKGP